MVDAVADLLDAGPGQALLRRLLRRRVLVGPRHPAGGAGAAARRYESWILDQVVPFIHERLRRARRRSLTTGCSMGAFHAANFALRRADLFPLALCLSGNYDPAPGTAGASRATRAYFNNPTDYVAALHGDHLEWLRRSVSLLLVCGQGSGRTPPARWTAPARSPACSRGRASRTSWTCGGTTCRTTGRRGGASSPTTCPRFC